MDKPKELWFKDIAKPDTVLDRSEGYLDRLSGCRDVNDRQYLGKRKSKGSQNYQEKRRPKIHNKVQAQITPESLIDDAKWLEERKKKFPRVDSKPDPKQPDSSSKDDKVTNIAKTNNSSSRPPYQISKSKNVSLFEKLMSDTEE